VYAAHASGDTELIKQVCKKFGLYDSNGMPIADQYAKYTESMQKYTQANAEEWTKFVTENNGKWKEYVKSKM